MMQKRLKVLKPFVKKLNYKNKMQSIQERRKFFRTNQ